MRRSRKNDESIFWEECLSVLIFEVKAFERMKQADIEGLLACCTLGDRSDEKKRSWWSRKLGNTAYLYGMRRAATGQQGSIEWIRRAQELAAADRERLMENARRAFTHEVPGDLAFLLFGQPVLDLGIGDPAQATEKEYGVAEGGLRMVTHLKRERDSNIVREAKRQARARGMGRLCCEVCGLAPEERFMVDIIEAHHRRPLSDADGVISTKVSDFAMLCPNCHRSVHKMKDCSLESLKEILSAVLPRPDAHRDVGTPGRIPVR